MVIIDVRRFDAFIFDLDGVITQTASIHARAWKRLFDEFLCRRAAQTGAAFVPFDLENDYRRYVDGKPRIAGVASFLAARGITVSTGAPGDQAEQETAHELASRKDHYFAELLTHEGVDVSASAESLLHEARRRGMRTAVASSSHHCAEILRTAGLTALFDARVRRRRSRSTRSSWEASSRHLPGSCTPSQRGASACGSLRGCRSGRRGGACGRFRPGHRDRIHSPRTGAARAWSRHRHSRSWRSPARRYCDQL